MNIKLLTKTAKLPTKAHPNDACFDIYADSETQCVVIDPHTTIKIPTGFATEIPHGYWGAVFARSGLATKRGLRPAQGVAVIDENYRGEWFIPIHNDTDEAQYIVHGDRIAQFCLMPCVDTFLNVVDNLDETDRGNGGFGSSGV